MFLRFILVSCKMKIEAKAVTLVNLGKIEYIALYHIKKYLACLQH